MSLRLESFKTSIPRTILHRGHDYYRNKRVIDLSYDEGMWEAQVRGSELYDVQIEKQAGGALRWECTCPYAETALCKHVAAVLYAIEAQLLKNPHASPSSDFKKPSKKALLRQALQAASHEALVDMLMNWVAKDRTLADQILLRLGVKGERSDDYKTLVKTALRQARDRKYGYIDGHHAARNLESLLEQAQDQLDHKQPMTAVAICFAITEECLSAFQELDDSDGDIGGIIQGATNIIEDCVPVLNTTEKKTLFELCLEHGAKMPHSGWDWEWSFYSTAAHLVTNTAERDQLFKSLDGRPSQSNSWGRSYDEDVKARIKLSVIERTDDTEAADTFLNANIHLDDVRQKLIRQAITKNLLPRAIELTMEGIRRADERKLPGLALEYQRLLVDVAVEQRDGSLIAKLIPAIWLHRGGEDLYELLRRSVPADEWPAFLKKELIEGLRPADPRAAWIYKREGMWKDLLQITRQYPAAYLSDYCKDLESEFPEEMCKLYEHLVFQTVQDVSSGREGYKIVCSYLYQLQQLGEEERVIEIVEQLKAQYPRRKALMEELKQL